MSCEVEEQSKFFWWKWWITYYVHDWGYTEDGRIRVCSKCKREELFFGKDQDGLEDWRKLARRKEK